MGFDLYMVRTPDKVPDHYPEIIRESPGYFRGVPYEYLEAAGVLDHRQIELVWPEWPAGMTKERAERLNDLFEPLLDDPPPSSSPPGVDLLDLKPTFREIRAMARHVAACGRVNGTASRTPGKVPSIQFQGNDGFHVAPEECLVIACRLSLHLGLNWLKGVTEAEGAGPMRMRLKSPHRDAIESPTAEQVVAEIDRLNHEEKNPFFILEDESYPHVFMQARKVSSRLFVVEYAEGEPQRQFEGCKIPKRRVNELFLAYLRRDNSFKSMAEWKEITEELFGDSRRELEWVRAFIAFNELAARYGGYEVW